MPIVPTQSDSTVRVKSPLGADVLLLRRMSYSEALSEPFVLALELLSEDNSLKPTDLLGQPMTVEMDLPSGGKRFYSGVVTQFGVVGAHGHFTSYRAVCRPWFWVLTRTSNCRIFQEMTAPDIIKQIFRDQGFSDFEDNLAGNYRVRTYCVQYRETDFEFVSRLMEEEGIYYFPKHEDGKDALVLGDDYGSHSTIQDESELPFRLPGEGAGPEHATVSSLHVRQAVKPGAYVVNSFDFERPGADLMAVSSQPKEHAQASFEMYDYDADYIQVSDGDHYAKVHLQERQALHEKMTGTATARTLAAGGLFSLVEHPQEALNREYLLILTKQSITADPFESGTGDEFRYECSFVALDSRVPFRPKRKTARAIVHGPQTATVVGKKGEEIWTDKYGRVKVQFHWDREGKQDENSSCWLRVAQLWGGGSFGGIQIPRIGEEVIVDFLEGDPDRPIVTGRVYNGSNMPPYDLPDNQTQMGIKTRSSPNGSADNFNELRFEDKKDEEEIYFHAEKNFNRVVENDDTLKVGFDKKDKGDRTVEIHNNETRTVGNDQTETIGNDQTLKIGFEKKSSGDQKIEIFNDRTVKIGNDDSLTVDKGNRKIDVKLGKTEQKAMQSIELKVGGSSIKIEPAKITIKSPVIEIKADAQLKATGAMAQVEGSAMCIVKGGILKLN